MDTEDHYVNDGHPECEDDYFVWRPPADTTARSLRSALATLRQLERGARERGAAGMADDWADLIAAYEVMLERSED